MVKRRSWSGGVALLLGLPLTVALAWAADPGPLRAAAAAPTSLSVFAAGLEHPWALAFLPDGSMLVTERAGRLRRVSADGQRVSAPIEGLPPVRASGQGGLLDVVVDPQFEDEPWVYWSYAEAGQGDESGLAGTAVARARLDGDRLRDVQVIFRQQPKVRGSGHFGSRLVFDRDGRHLFVTLGDRQLDSTSRPGRDWAQNPAVGLGKVVRIARDGTPAGANPPVAGGFPGLWSLGHRNPQGAALHPSTGELWIHEHGPQGGDELNIVRAGRNFGWPLKSYGCSYGAPVGHACQVGGGRHAPDFVEPITTWVPTSIAPSGMAFVTAARYPAWQGSLVVGALRGQALWRLVLEGDRVVGREELFASERRRIRDVRQGPDGRLYLLTDDPQAQILRTEP